MIIYNLLNFQAPGNPVYNWNWSEGSCNTTLKALCKIIGNYRFLYRVLSLFLKLLI